MYAQGSSRATRNHGTDLIFLLLVSLLGVLVVGTLLVALTGGWGGWMMGYYAPRGAWGGMFLVGALAMGGLLVLVVLLFVVLVRGRSAGSGPPAAPSDPFEVVRLRYAKGEITKAEYDALEADLRR